MQSSEKCATLDPLGFSKQTEILLCGLGGEHLVSEFKKRNISTAVLHELTKEDFIKLGADDSNAERMINELKVIQKNLNQSQTSLKDRVDDFLHILKNGEQHLSLIHAAIVYSRLRLQEEQIDIVIDPDKNITASKALHIGTGATLNEINDAEQAAVELENLISKVVEDCKVEDKSQYSCIRYSAITTTVVVVAYTVLLTYRYYRRVPFF